MYSKFNARNKYMNKYKVQFKQTETYIVDVLAENQDQAEKLASDEWNNGYYQDTGDCETIIDMVYDVTNTDDPFNA